MIHTIVSGHQTGVDIGAIDAAISLGVRTSGFVPRGRLTEVGPLAACYTSVTETASDSYVERTRKNVETADLTILFYRDSMGPGTKLTVRECEALGKEYYVYDLAKERFDELVVLCWDIVRDVDSRRELVVNWAGSRESSSPGIQKQTYKIVREVIRRDRG